MFFVSSDDPVLLRSMASDIANGKRTIEEVRLSASCSATEGRGQRAKFSKRTASDVSEPEASIIATTI